MRAFDFDSSRNPTRTQTLNRKEIDTEYTLESWLHANPQTILDEPLLIFGRQYGLSTGIPDLLALDEWGNTVVVELKKGKSGSGSASEETILSQPQNYAQSLSSYGYDDLEEIYQEYKNAIRDGDWEVEEEAVVEDTLAEAHKEAFGSGLDRSEFNENQRMVILAEEITPRTETNARYLLEQGLNVQCVEVQVFQVPEGAMSEDYSVMVSSTVVDYPVSRVRPERSSADYSNLTNWIGQRVSDRVEDREGIERVRSTPTQVRVESMHPEGLQYQVYIPGSKSGRQANIRMNASEVPEEYIEDLRSVLSDSIGEIEDYVVEDGRVMNIVHRERSVGVSSDSEEDVIGQIADELTTLVEVYHPKLAGEF